MHWTVECWEARSLERDWEVLALVRELGGASLLSEGPGGAAEEQRKTLATVCSFVRRRAYH